MIPKKICVITGTRAEYGLLYWLIKAIDQDEHLLLQLVVTGMHLSPEFGMTYRVIEKDGFLISKKIEMLLSSDTAIGIAKSMGLATISFSECFEELKPNVLVILGDRYEIFAAASAAMIANIPIAHIHGGEATQGLIDEPIRHSLTKMSHLHFVATHDYRKRVIQLGENPKHVFNVGGMGIENIKKLTLLNREEFEKSINFKLAEKNILVTFHPVTLEKNTAETQFANLLEVLESLEKTHIIFTKTNSDTDGRIINRMIDEFVDIHKNKSIAFTSLGQLRYLSTLQFVDAVIGNSSSGLIEVPSFKIPTINMGDRQKGRIKADSVIDCTPDTLSIKKAFETAFSKDFKSTLDQVKNPYDNSKYPSEEVVKILKSINLKNILKKSFFDINF